MHDVVGFIMSNSLKISQEFVCLNLTLTRRLRSLCLANQLITETQNQPKPCPARLVWYPWKYVHLTIYKQTNNRTKHYKKLVETGESKSLFHGFDMTRISQDLSRRSGFQQLYSFIYSFEQFSIFLDCKGSFILVTHDQYQELKSFIYIIQE